jgi:FG-GAP repeat
VTSAAYLTNAGSPWTAVAVGDFDGDTKTDIVVKNTDGSYAIVLMNGTAVTSAGLLGSGFELQSIGEFNGDGKADLIVKLSTGAAAGYIYVLYISGIAVTGNSPVLGPGYTVFP